jgi:heat shock protein HtpX
MKHSETVYTLRRIAPLAFWIVVFGLAGDLLAGLFGAFLGILIAVIWTICALAGADRYAVYFHNGRPLNRIEAPNLHEMVEELAANAGIEQPVLYALPFNEPNIVVCDGFKKGARSRIGLTRGLTLALERDEVYTLLGLAIARIVTGEASAVSTSTTASGLLMQFASSSVVNFTIRDWIQIDPECGLTPIGKAILLILAPAAWLTNRLGFPWAGCLEADAVGARLVKNNELLARTLEKIADATPAPELGSTAGFNPGTAPAFLISPFEGTLGIESGVIERPFWQKARLWIALQTPSARKRAGLLLGSPLPEYDDLVDRYAVPRSSPEHVTWPPVG